MSKLQDIEVLSDQEKPDLILLTETWCNDRVSNCNLNICNYELIKELRRDRTDTRDGIGGGLLVYAKKGLQILSHDNQIDFNQYVHFSLKTFDSPVNIFLVYKPPSSNVNNQEKLCDLINSIPKNSVLIGDFNYPNIDWENNTADSNISRKFMETCLENNLTQYVDFPTHIRNNILDLVLANDNCVLSVSDLGHLGNSDHNVLKIITKHNLEPSEDSIKIKDWRNADFQSMKRELKCVSWNRLLKDKDTEESWNTFSELLEKIVSDNVPIKCIKKNGKPAWITPDIDRLDRKKSRLYKKMKETQNASDIENYHKVRKEYKKKIRASKRKLEVKISKSRGNSGRKMFTNYVKNKLSDKNGIGPLLDGDKMVSDDQEMAQLLNKYFCETFTEDNGTVPEIKRPQTEATLSDMEITVKMVKDKIEALKSRKAPGPDQITTDILKILKDEVCIPIWMIFQRSLNSGDVPKQWRIAKVIALFKKGAKGKPGNYRGVSLTCEVGKMMESILRDMITDHLISNQLINLSQHGFMPNRSCQTNLLEFLDQLFSMLDENEPVDIVYLDFSRAFDKVSHSKLIQKLNNHGIKGKIQEWIKSWLRDRLQYVEINGKRSETGEVKSGVPQGSVLGPLLFIIFINDLEYSVVLNILRKFADDTKGASKVKSEEDVSNFQKALDSLVEWSKDWGMHFNTSKCKIMHCGKNNRKADYYMEGVKLNSVDSERDIGVYISSNMKPSSQCADAANKAKAVLNQVTRAFHYRDKNVFIRLYKQFVRPHVEFSSCVWSPWTVADIKCVEQVQIKAVKMVSGLAAQDYESRLKELNLWTLEKRRKMADLVQCFKIVHGIGKVECGLKKVEANQSRILTRNLSDNLNLQKPVVKTELRRNFYSVRVIDSWNKLPSDIKHSTNISIFKKKLTKWME